MVDRISLTSGETALINTSSNAVSIAVCSGSVGVADDRGNWLVVLSAGETFTLPISTGVYSLIGNPNAELFIFRYFVLP